MSFCRTKIPWIFTPLKRILPSGGSVKTSQLVFLMADVKRLGGRPALTAGKRNRKIDVRFTQDEFEKILSMEKELGVGRTELLRMRLLQNADKIVLNSAALIRALDKIGADMGRIGNNINQLAKHANRLNQINTVPPSIVAQFNLLIEEYITIQRSLEQSLRKTFQTQG